MDYRFITYAEYKKLLIKNLHNRAEEESLVRKIYSAIVNYSGMGRKEYISDEKLWNIALYDNEVTELPIRTRGQAIKLLKELIA